jgi:transposase InsO family protein
VPEKRHRSRSPESSVTFAGIRTYVESFNGRLRDECLNEHWFTSLAHARVEIERWRREYNEERPKKSLGGLTPALYAKQLASKALTMTAAL